jgi:FecR-like protein
MEVIMVKRFSIGAALVALTVGASGVSVAQSGSKAKASKPAPLARVEAVQMPAWVERDGASIPLAPGMELKDRDEVKTGERSRVYIRTADGSAVKLGENGALSFDGMRLRQDNAFEAAMKVAEGAFRFTSEFFAQFRGTRDVKVTIRTVTAGIRGTDLWGKSAPDRQIVCLIEGKVEVTQPNDTPFTMDERLSVYQNENGVSRPVTRVLPDQLREWAAETETREGEGVSKRGGRWKVTAPGLASSQALDLYEGLRRSGYAAEIIPAKLEDKRVYNVRLSQLETRKDAEAVASELKQLYNEYDFKAGM